MFSGTAYINKLSDNINLRHQDVFFRVQKNKILKNNNFFKELSVSLFFFNRVNIYHQQKYLTIFTYNLLTLYKFLDLYHAANDKIIKLILEPLFACFNGINNIPTGS